VGKKLAYLGLLVFLLLGLLLPACSKSTPTTTSSVPPKVTTTQPANTTTSSPTTTAIKTTTAPATTSASGNQQRGGTLKIAMISDANFLGDPGEVTSQGRAMMKPAVEQLGRLDLTGQVTPWLAENWQTDSKALTLTVTLKKGIKFQDGTPFNAEAVKWNWDYQTGAKITQFNNVKSVDVVDEYTVRANLKVWDNAIVVKLCNTGGSIVSPTNWQTNGKDWGQTHPVGTGPFLFVSWTKGVGVVYTLPGGKERGFRAPGLCHPRVPRDENAAVTRTRPEA
jgi:peptide/nickel transport system substrate-binding protein